MENAMPFSSQIDLIVSVPTPGCAKTVALSVCACVMVTPSAAAFATKLRKIFGHSVSLPIRKGKSRCEN